MTDAHFTRLDQYRDLESLNAYRQRVEEAKVQSSESMMAGLARAAVTTRVLRCNGTVPATPVSPLRTPPLSHGFP